MPQPASPWTWYSLHLPKHGNGIDEYEDAFSGNPKVGRFAVADGASESSYAREWARLLVDGFVQPLREAGSRRNWLEPLRQRWAEAVGGRELPWYAEVKREQGAFATFLGLSLKRSGRAWRALAIGDSCLFQVRGGNLLKGFPLTRAAQFGNQPELIGSRTNGDGEVRRVQAQGTWVPGDRFFMMTDALAQWALQECEAGRQPWPGLRDLFRHAQPQSAFAHQIAELRSQGRLRNDDVTLVVVKMRRRTMPEQE